MLLRDLGIEVALTTINDAVLRVGELLIPVVDCDEARSACRRLHPGRRDLRRSANREKKGKNHTAYFWQYSSPGKGVVFDFEMTRRGEVPKKFFKDYGGILHTDGYAAYEKDIGAEGMIHACCIAHARQKVYRSRQGAMPR